MAPEGIDLTAAAEALRASGRDVDGTTVRGNVKVVTTEQVVQLLERAGAGGGGGDEHAMHMLEARLAEADSRAEIAEAESRRRAAQINDLETQLQSAGAASAPAGDTDPAEARDYVDLVEQPDYAGLLVELDELREDLSRLESRLGGGSGEVRELATAIMKALGGDEDEEPAAGGEAGATVAGVELLRHRADVIEGDVQRDQEAVAILFDAMLDGNGTVSVVSELIALTTRGIGYAGEVRSMRRALGLIAEIPIAD